MLLFKTSHCNIVFKKFDASLIAQANMHNRRLRMLLYISCFKGIKTGTNQRQYLIFVRVHNFSKMFNTISNALTGTRVINGTTVDGLR
jgi:hypothetical protein